jgi:hypothetical protein
VLGETTGSDEPATDTGIDRSAELLPAHR